MEIPSIIVHKGEKESKYELYIEDYVISYLKYETEKMDLSEIFFYGRRDKNKRGYFIYGAAREKQISYFERYDMLEEVGCRLTQAGPFFIIRDNNLIYEVKGYNIFYQKNEEMESYLVAVKQLEGKVSPPEEVKKIERKINSRAYQRGAQEQKGKSSYGWISLQLCAIFIVLLAIVITSTNSYDKMGQLNQASKEVFFALENQSAQVEKDGGETGSSDMAIREDADAGEQAVSQAEGDAGEEWTGSERKEETMTGFEAEGIADKIQETSDISEIEEVTGKIQAVSEEDREKVTEQEVSNAEENIEALSRNVMRYYRVEQGDTLCAISKKIYGDTSKVEQMCQLNQITDPDNIICGQKIILP